MRMQIASVDSSFFRPPENSVLRPPAGRAVTTAAGHLASYHQQQDAYVPPVFTAGAAQHAGFEQSLQQSAAASLQQQSQPMDVLESGYHTPKAAVRGTSMPAILLPQGMADKSQQPVRKAVQQWEEYTNQPSSPQQTIHQLWSAGGRHGTSAASLATRTLMGGREQGLLQRGQGLSRGYQWGQQQPQQGEAAAATRFNADAQQAETLTRARAQWKAPGLQPGQGPNLGLFRVSPYNAATTAAGCSIRASSYGLERQSGLGQMGGFTRGPAAGVGIAVSGDCGGNAGIYPADSSSYDRVTVPVVAAPAGQQPKGDVQQPQSGPGSSMSQFTMLVSQAKKSRQAGGFVAAATGAPGGTFDYSNVSGSSALAVSATGARGLGVGGLSGSIGMGEKNNTVAHLGGQQHTVSIEATAGGSVAGAAAAAAAGYVSGHGQPAPPAPLGTGLGPPVPPAEATDGDVFDAIGDFASVFDFLL